ncbi:integrase, catalytic region, zinc finger, CCHC-type containing protein [Tanacetum coccineum]
MKDVFESTESDFNATWTQNELLNDQLLEAKLKHEIECCVLLSHECVNNKVQDEIEKIQRDSIEIQERRQKKNRIKYSVKNDVQDVQKLKVRAQNQDLLITISELKTKLKNVEKDNNMQDDIEKIQRDSIEIQEGMQKQINILENDAQRCLIQSLDFELQLQHGKERQKCESSLKSVCETYWISKMEKLERLGTTSSVRRPSNRDSSFKNSVLPNTNNSLKKVEVSDMDHNKQDVASNNFALDKKIVTNDDIKNALIAKNVLCVSCAKNVLIPCHDNCLAKYKLNVHSNVRRSLFTTPRTVKSTFKETTPLVLKTRFSVKIAQSKSLDTTPVVSKTKIAAVTPLSAKNKVSIQIVLWIVDSGCSKHMMGYRSLLKNFVEKFIGTVRFGNDHFAAITSYGDYVQGNIIVCHVYYVEGIGHNLFSVGQFCDGDLEVSFRSKTCYVQNLEGDDLLTGDHESNLYTISISDMAASSLVCLMSKATSTKSWLWHRRLSHLSFGTINDLTKYDLVDGLLIFKYDKDHLYSVCERGKSKKASHPPKLVPSSHSKLDCFIWIYADQ